LAEIPKNEGEGGRTDNGKRGQDEYFPAGIVYMSKQKVPIQEDRNSKAVWARTLVSSLIFASIVGSELERGAFEEEEKKKVG
jgi:hypothetical protein